VMEKVAGWSEGLEDCDSVADLPGAARGYVQLIERELEVSVTHVGTGAARGQVLSGS